jgi:hypothetical protein
LTRLTFGEELWLFFEDAFGPKGLSVLSLLLARADLTLLDRLTCFTLDYFSGICGLRLTV